MRLFKAALQAKPLLQLARQLPRSAMSLAGLTYALFSNPQLLPQQSACTRPKVPDWQIGQDSICCKGLAAWHSTHAAMFALHVSTAPTAVQRILRALLTASKLWRQGVMQHIHIICMLGTS